MDNNYVSAGAVLAPLERGRAEIIVSFCRDGAKGAWEDVANGTMLASSLPFPWRLACVLTLLGLRLLPYPITARALLPCLVHRSAWKDYSTNFVSSSAHLEEKTNV